MKIFIELPSWLGDSVMATACIEHLCNFYQDAQIVFFGSLASTSLFENHPNKKSLIIDNSKKAKNRFFFLYKLAKSLDEFDLAISLRSSFASKIFLFFLKAKEKHQFNKNVKGHQVEKYLNLAKSITKASIISKDLKLYFNKEIYKQKTLGLNPGASYGSAKRWYPEYFAQVGIELGNEFNILIFGGPGEIDIANLIEKTLKANNVNCTNLVGLTSIKELCQKIGGLDLFITNDSGPMHIACAFKTPTIALFGPTKDEETSPWQNPKSIIIKKSDSCSLMPCMKRICPIKTHICMKSITPQDVLKSVNLILP